MDMPFDATSGQTDDALLALYARGDAAAARALTARLTPRAFAQAQRLLGDAAEAEDVAQEAMLRLWRMAPKWQAGRAQVTTWLYRVVANLCTDRLRRRRTTALDDGPEPLDDALTAEARITGAARMAALDDALAALPERQRQAVVLRHLDGLGNPEIAEIMDITTEAVESLTARGKRALRAALGPRKSELGIGDD